MKPLVQNAASPKQQKTADQRLELKEQQYRMDLGHMLSMPQGRRMLWRILEKCRVFETIWENSARIHYNAGQQDLGHWLMAEINGAGDEFLFLMMKENKKEGL